MRENKYKVWCLTHGEWEKHQCWLSPGGQLIHWEKNIPTPLLPENHIVVFYTGLKDIYDGDIVTRRNRPDLPCLVYFEEADFSYRLAVRGDKQIDKTYPLRFAGEVIGNIHENPELLKGE